MTLEEAKTQGVVGEQPNGYLGVVQPGASAEVQALVNDVNQKRRHMYEDIARRNSTKLEAVEMLAGKTAIDNTRLGTSFGVHRGSGSRSKQGNICGRGSAWQVHLALRAHPLGWERIPSQSYWIS